VPELIVDKELVDSEQIYQQIQLYNNEIESTSSISSLTKFFSKSLVALDSISFNIDTKKTQSSDLNGDAANGTTTDNFDDDSNDGEDEDDFEDDLGRGQIFNFHYLLTVVNLHVNYLFVILNSRKEMYNLNYSILSYNVLLKNSRRH